MQVHATSLLPANIGPQLTQDPQVPARWLWRELNYGPVYCEYAVEWMSELSWELFQLGHDTVGLWSLGPWEFAGR